MSESELQAYRFLSGKEPSEEQLQAIMEAASVEARHRAVEAKKRYEEQYDRIYKDEYSRIHQRIEAARNGIF